MAVAGSWAAGCSDDSGGEEPYTVLVVVVQFNPQLYSIDQFRFEGYLSDGNEAFAPGVLPETPGHLFASGQESVAIVLNDSLAGQVIRARVHGLNQGQVEASGQNAVTPVRHDTVELVITLGDPAVCGDQAVRSGIEDCDDGNTSGGDGCSGACVQEQGYTCAGQPSVCTPICGDGLIRGLEGCDDGNVAVDDGCSSDCSVEQGFGCTGDEPSVCSPICGDGLVLGGEPCDDGNTEDGDGCGSDCQIETGWQCSGQPSACIFPCDEHGQCDHVCDISAGACVKEENIFFVDCSVTCPGSGTLGDPYCSVGAALSDATEVGQFILVMPGTCDEFVDVTSGVNIVGQAGAIVENQNCPAVSVTSAAARIENLEIRGVWTGSRFDGGGVRVQAGAEVTLAGNVIADGDCVGVDCQNSTCVLHRNLIRANEGGGVDVQNSDFSIVNNFVVQNGNDLSARWGGVRINAASASPAEFINNTVADNLIEDGQFDPGGVDCVTAVTLTNCILWNNDNNEVSGCTVTFTDIDQTGYAGNNGNINANPRFEGSGDYHIDAVLSPCLDIGTATGAPSVDFDGDPRPQGTGVDMGADEAG